MHSQLLDKQRKIIKRKMRVRKGLRKGAAKPRLCVFKSNLHIYAQIIDDEQGMTIASFSTKSKELKENEFKSKSKQAAKEVGKRLAELAKSKNVDAVVFDRGQFKYHGLVAELAAGAREGGLKF